jgi:uncharacterized protein
MTAFRRPVTSGAELRALIGEPSSLALAEQQAALDTFIARSPFLMMATSGATGQCDVSPKGDAPGFVLVLEEETLRVNGRTRSPGATVADLEPALQERYTQRLY